MENDLANDGITPDQWVSPIEPRPWSEAMNALFLRMVEFAWRDLTRLDQKQARAALDFIESGATVIIINRYNKPVGVSLFEEWGWPSKALSRHARMLFESVHGPATPVDEVNPTKSTPIPGTSVACTAGMPVLEDE